MKRKFYVELMLLILLLPLLAACGTDTSVVETAIPGVATEVTGAATQLAGATEVTGAATQLAGATEVTGAATAVSNVLDNPTATAASSSSGAAGKPFTIGISNPFISSEYRTQMIQELIDTNKEYMDQGITTELVIESADTDVPGQIQQLQNLINKGVDAILVNPGDVNGLNDTLQDAINKGIIVISVDQELPTANVYNVGIDQKEWAKVSAKWLAEKLGGKGNIVEIEGFAGHPANNARMSGVEEVLQGYPDIKILGKDSGKWDEATGQQVMSNFLASFPTMDAYWTQDGMAIGAWQAVLAANPAKFPVPVLEARCQALTLWDDRLKADPAFESIAVANPPGVAPTGLRIAVNMLLGKQVNKSKLAGTNSLSFVLPIPFTVTKENFAEVYASQCTGKPPAYLLDGIMTDQEVQQYFQ